MAFGSSDWGETIGLRWPDLRFYERQWGDGGVRWREMMSKNMSKAVVGTLAAIAQAAKVHVTEGPDGSLSVPASKLADVGIYAGDAVVVAPEPRRRVRSMLGIHDPGIEFELEDQRAIRAEMAGALGEDLTR
jgi:hypothetical protein